VLETNNGATILFTCHGYVHTAPDGVRRRVGAMTHISDHERYRWFNNVICAVTGVVERSVAPTDTAQKSSLRSPS
jgi:hypothetical protein